MVIGLSLRLSLPETMRNYFNYLFLLVLSANPVVALPNNFGEILADSIIDRYQPDIDTLTHKGWDHSNTAILNGISKLYLNTDKPEYLDYIKAFIDRYIDEKGNLDLSVSNSLDRMHPGLICVFLFKQTGEERYRIAAKKMRDHFVGTESKPSIFSKTPDGGYCHKSGEKYRNVMTVDGIYPFLAAYARVFDESELFDLISDQILLIADHSFNTTAGLPYHGWNYDKSKAWANPITGTSSQFWSRASGWFAMGLVDVIEAMPPTHPKRETLSFLYRSLATGLLSHQAPDGMWYHVLNRIEDERNYPETSATSMIIYSLCKGYRLGLLGESAKEGGLVAWQALQGHVKTYEDGGPQLLSVAPAMGIQNDYEAYLSIRPVSVPRGKDVQHPHGYIGMLMAASEIRKIAPDESLERQIP